MINQWDPRIILSIALALLLLGFALPALMILQILPSTLLLNLLAYCASFTGLTVGIIAAVLTASRGWGG